IRHLPVVDENGFLEGIVSIRDIAVELARMLVDMEVMGITMEEKEMIKSLSEEIDINVDEGRGF
ncbi:MAG: CBS domain-containing protein, partial [Thermocladium sp.]